jgi:hypothetical protein
LQICDLNLAKLLDSSNNSSSLAALNPRWLVRSRRSPCSRLSICIACTCGRCRCRCQESSCRVPLLPCPPSAPALCHVQAPEVMSGERAGPAADAFSFGVVLWELCKLELPWSKTNPYQVGSPAAGWSTPALG